jgi:hypothetical protein
MKHLSIQKTIEPDIRFRSINDWYKHIAKEVKKVKGGRNVQNA